MKNNSIILFVSACLFVGIGSGAAFGQGFSSILEKLDDLETRLNGLETTEKSDFGKLQRHLSEDDPAEGEFSLQNSVALLEWQVDNLSNDLEMIKNDGDNSDNVETATLAGDLREIMGALRSSISDHANAGNSQFPQKVFFDGSVRWRSEFDDKDFVDSTSIYERTFLRMRFGARFHINENSEAYIQFQDSRNMGTNSAGLSNDNNLGVHQAYIKASDLFREGFTLQIGRFAAPTDDRGY